MKIINQAHNKLVDTKNVWKCNNFTVGTFEILCDEGVLATYFTKNKRDLEFNKIIEMSNSGKPLTLSDDDDFNKYWRKKQEMHKKQDTDGNYNYHGRLIPKNDFLEFFMSEISEKLDVDPYKAYTREVQIKTAFRETCKKFNVPYIEDLYNLHGINQYFRSLNLVQYKRETYCEDEKQVETSDNIKVIDDVLNELDITHKNEDGMWCSLDKLMNILADGWNNAITNS